MTKDRVTSRVSDYVADVRLNRPDKLNALDPAMMKGLIETGRSLTDRASGSAAEIRCVVLSGEGRAFCAGLDFMAFMADGLGTELLEEQEGPANRAQEVAYVWSAMPVPVIVAISGEAFGGGLQIALGGDVRILGHDARLSVMEIKWGLVPDMTGTQTLRHLVRLDVAKELAFTGRIVEAEEAVHIGLGTRIAVDPRAAALEMARTIAGKSPDAIRGAKQLLNAAGYVTLEEGLQREARIQRALIGSTNQLEAVAANLQEREPNFT